MAANPTKPVERSEFTSFISALELLWIRLMEAHIEAKQPAPNPKDSEIEVSGEASLHPDGEKFQARQQFKIIFKSKKDKSEIGKIEARFALSFQPTAPIDAALLQKVARPFIESQVPFIVWPYFREYVQNMMGRMGWPVLTMPLMKQGPPPEAKAEAKPIEGHARSKKTAASKSR